MNKRYGLLVLIPVLIGLGALGLLVMDPAQADKILAIGGFAMGGGVILLAVIAIPRALSRSSSQVIGEEDEALGYHPPEVIAARLLSDGRGELEVLARHHEHIRRELSLPGGKEIAIVEPNRLYKIRWDTPDITIPENDSAEVFDRAGRRKIVMINGSQRETSLRHVEEWSRVNGFSGQIQG